MLRRILFLCLLLGAVVLNSPVHAQESPSPIAGMGHGALFDSRGRQLVPTDKLITNAIAWYKSNVYARASAELRLSYDRQLREARAARAMTVNQQLLLELRAVEWLYANAPAQPGDDKHRRALNALAYLLRFELPRTDTDVLVPYARPFALGADFERFIQQSGFRPPLTVTPLSATVNSGQAYITECRNNAVPIPPPIGDSRWVSQGFIPTDQLFLVNTSVEVMTYKSTSPEGLCIALPRSNDTNPADGVTVALDGIVCLGKRASPLTGKSSACFWDNQMNGSSFPFLKGTKIPIGWNDPAQVSPNPSGNFMSGGAQLTSGSAGMCSDCHAGQNPFIVHPRNPVPPKPFGQAQNPSAETVLGKLGKPPLNLPMFGDTWYDPIVLASWPQNRKRLNDAYVPAACQGCHTAGGMAGQLPHLSTELTGYCDMVLAKSIQTGLPHSMPQGNPGSAANDIDVKAIADLTASASNPTPFCAIGPTAGPSDRGDPHIVTTNGIAYDFQAAGEFVALKDEDGSFELQTRQSPVTTTFTPGANAYTGLASCVSLNTAVALKLGSQRVTYQQVGPSARDGRMELRIGGRVKTLDRGTLDLGSGSSITANGAGSLTFTAADGTRVIATPTYWQSQGYWHIVVEVLNTTARAGLMGHVAAGEWLPRGGDRTNFGAMPAALTTRYKVLYGKFGESWRVTDQTSLFDYPAGQSTKYFTDPDWPSTANNCQSTVLAAPAVREPLSYDVAKQACSSLNDKAAREQCLFDVQVLGDVGVLKAYSRSLELRAAVQAGIR
ncbi:hypothetical protein [Aestuariivirga sp.]|uniref:hypothetical protein n=1 Tax=Aestuariivirga sp. TaxID=2650926 RepID=UPI003BA8C8DA